MSDKLRFDLLLSTAHRPDTAQEAVFDDAVEATLQAEALGYGGVWLLEHHFTRYGLCPSALTMAAYLAGCTRRIRVGTAITILPLDHPWKVAERAALVDQLSGGRLDFGVGRGSYARDFEAFGVDMSQNHTLMQEAMDGILKAWESEPLSLPNTTGHAEMVQINPKPRGGRRPPVYVASNSPNTIAWAAANGFGMLIQPALDDDAKREQIARYAAAARESAVGGGGGVASRHALTCIGVLGDTEDEARDMARKHLSWWIKEGVTSNGLLARRDRLPNYDVYFKAVDSQKKAGAGDAAHVVDRFVDLNLIGTPERCRNRLLEIIERTGIRHVIIGFEANAMGAATYKAMADFKREVLDRVSARFGS